MINILQFKHCTLEYFKNTYEENASSDFCEGVHSYILNPLEQFMKNRFYDQSKYFLYIAIDNSNQYIGFQFYYYGNDRMVKKEGKDVMERGICNLYGLFVENEHRRKGIARKLTELSIDAAFFDGYRIFKSHLVENARYPSLFAARVTYAQKYKNIFKVFQAGEECPGL